MNLRSHLIQLLANLAFALSILTTCTPKDPIPMQGGSVAKENAEIISGSTCGNNAIDFPSFRLQFFDNCYKVETVKDTSMNNFWELDNKAINNLKRSIGVKVLFDHKPTTSGIYNVVSSSPTGNSCNFAIQNALDINNSTLYTSMSGYVCTVQITNEIIEVAFDKVGFSTYPLSDDTLLFSGKLSNKK